MNRQRYKDLAAAVNKHFEGEEPKDIRAFRSRLSVLLRSSELQLSVMGAYHAVLNAQQEVLHEYDSSSFDWEKAVGALEDALCRLLSPCHFGDFPVTEEELKTGFSLLKLDSTTPFSGLESFNDRDWPSSPSSLLTFHVTELVLILLFCGVPKLKGVGTLIFKDYHHLLEPVIRDLINKRVIKKSKSTLLLPWPLLPGHQVRTQLLDPLKTEIFENYFEAYEKFKTEILHNKSVALSEETAPQLFLVVLDCTAAGLAALDLSEPAAPFVDSFDDADVYSFVEACSVSLSLLQDNDSIFAANLLATDEEPLPKRKKPRVDLDECCIEVNSGRSDALLKHLFDTIEASREFGITLAQLQQSVRIPTLLEDLNFLVEECLVYKVGRNVYRYITFKHVRPWALYKTSLCSRADNSLDGSQDAHQFFTSVDEAQNLQVVWEEPIVRKPWIGLDGKVNQRAWKSLSLAVLNIIIERPGIEEKAIALKVSALTTILSLKTLLGIWSFRGALYNKRYYAVPPPSLFSSPPDFSNFFLQADQILDEEKVSVAWFPSVNVRLVMAQYLR